MVTQTPSARDNSRQDLSRIEFIALIAALMSLNAMAIDVMLPALPDIGASLNIENANDRPLILTSYLLGVAIAQLLFGPLTDRFGRRAPLLVGISIYVVTALTAALAPGFLSLLLLRFAQGLGAAAFRVIGLAIVRDRYEGRAMAEIMSLTFMALLIVPVIAPGIGQLLLFVGPWQGIFLFVGLFGAVVGLWAFFRLPETLDPADQRPLTIHSIADGFRIVLANRFSMLYAAMGMIIFGALMGMINSSQQIFVGIYGLGSMFPVAFAAMASSMVVASFLNSRIVRIYGMRRITHFALMVYTASGALLLIASLAGYASFPVFFILLVAAMFMFSWILPNSNALSMEPLGKVAGTAASTFGFFQTLGGTLIGLWIGRYFDGTVTPIALGFTIVGLISIIFMLVAEKGRLFAIGESETKQSQR